MMKKVFFSLLAVSLIAFFGFILACIVGWTPFTVWGMMISGIAVVVLVVICYWIQLGECDFESPNVRHRNLFE